MNPPEASAASSRKLNQLNRDRRVPFQIMMPTFKSCRFQFGDVTQLKRETPLEKFEDILGIMIAQVKHIIQIRAGSPRKCADRLHMLSTEQENNLESQEYRDKEVGKMTSQLSRMITLPFVLPYLRENLEANEDVPIHGLVAVSPELNHIALGGRCI
ncbi:hypothetical protein K3495_g6562 [Podosphaera aphanis]|nr:hypothetical protein K3495_g6562 [Podosphaera aphanis]